MSEGQLLAVYVGTLAGFLFGTIVSKVCEVVSRYLRERRRFKDIAKPSREFFNILDEMRNYMVWDVSKDEFKTVLNRFATKVENAVAGEGMRNCDRFDNWEDAMDYFYINVCNKSEEESKRTIRMSDGEPSAAFMTWLYSPYKRGM